MRKFKELREQAISKFGRDPYNAYLQHKTNAKLRGVEFLMDFPVWLEMWGEQFADCGTRKGQMNMCRTGDTGPYEAGNVRIDTTSGNHFERVQSARRNAIKEAWTFDGVDNTSSADWLDNRRDMGYL